MEQIFLHEEMILFCVEADSFPEGILPAFQQLHSFFQSNEEREIFGISRPENGKIIYKAAAMENTNGEFSKHQLPVFILSKGKYMSILVKDFKNNFLSINNAFKQLTSLSNIDLNGYCIEWYQGERDVLCLVKILE
jgi:hypothetical protein